MVICSCFSLLELVHPHAQQSPSPDGQSPPTFDHLGQQLDEIVNANANSYHILLWKAFHALRGLKLENLYHPDTAVAWTQVQLVLERQHIPLRQHWSESGDKNSGSFIYTFKTNIHIVGSEFPQDFYVLFEVDDKTKTVFRATPHLLCRIALPFNDLKVQKIYPVDTVGYRALQLDEVVKYATTSPMLESMDISYGSLATHWVDYGAMGFDVELERSGIGSHGERLRATFWYAAASGLDFDGDQDGNPSTPSPEDAFRSKDTLSAEVDDPLYKMPEHGKPGIFTPMGSNGSVGEIPKK